MIRLFGKELNIEELFVGACIQYPFYFLIGWWVLPLMVVSAILWALGGAEKSNKLFRRLGVPVASSISVLLVLQWWFIPIFILPGWGSITLGYGMPDATDEGSFLGRLYLKFLKNYKLAQFATRITIYILYWASFILTGKILSLFGLIPVL